MVAEEEAVVMETGLAGRVMVRGTRGAPATSFAVRSSKVACVELGSEEGGSGGAGGAGMPDGQGRCGGLPRLRPGGSALTVLICRGRGPRCCTPAAAPSSLLARP